ncbi:MAG: tetratricopeptide repeat protein, partial [Patescibacteria group bacterium]|nr:tetratricopeptide repeat protein [Patescibacteria group bacterium]
IAALYPFAQSLASREYSAIPAGLSITRYVQFGMGQYGLFGAGLGRGTEGFWSTAELVSVEQAGAAPGLANAYVALLWEGGPVLLIAFLAFAFVPVGYVLVTARKRLRRLGPASIERKHELGRRKRALLLLGWLAAIAFVPLSFALLLATALCIVILEPRTRGDRISPAIHGDPIGREYAPSRMTVKITNRAVLGLARLCVVALFGVSVYGATVAASTILHPEQLDVAEHAASLSGFDNWAMARQYRTMALARAGSTGPNITDNTGSYDRALAKLSRNLLLHAEAAQFYRLAVQDAEAASRIAQAGLSIDQAYVPLVLERAAQLQEQGENEQALSMLLPHTDTSADVAYQAANLALAAGSADRAVSYYESAITQNPNHLQSRFELAQALISLNRPADALDQLQELESRTAEDDVQAREALQQLRDLV